MILNGPGHTGHGLPAGALQAPAGAGRRLPFGDVNIWVPAGLVMILWVSGA